MLYLGFRIIWKVWNNQKDGIAVLYDRYGDIGWGESGKVK